MNGRERVPIRRHLVLLSVPPVDSSHWLVFSGGQRVSTARDRVLRSPGGVSRSEQTVLRAGQGERVTLNWEGAYLLLPTASPLGSQAILLNS